MCVRGVCDACGHACMCMSVSVRECVFVCVCKLSKLYSNPPPLLLPLPNRDHIVTRAELQTAGIRAL